MTNSTTPEQPDMTDTSDGPGRKPATTPDDVLDAFSDRDDRAEPLTAPELAEILNCSRRTALNKLDALADRDDVASKKVGGRSRVWWVPIPADQERRETPAARAVDSPDRTPTGDDRRDDAAAGAHDVDDSSPDEPLDDLEADAREQLESWKPWRRVTDDELEARRRAVLAAWRHLRDAGEAAGGDLQDVAADAVDPDAAGYSSPEWLWKRAVRDALQDGHDTANLPGVVPPAERGSFYRFDEPAENE